MISAIGPASSLEPLIEEQLRYNATVVEGAEVRSERPLTSALRLPFQTISVPGSPEVELRLVRPDVVSGVYLHIHGGGFVFGSASMSDSANQRLAMKSRVAVASVEYRLAPGHPHPAAVEDCVSAATWLIRHSEQEFASRRLLIGGESVGASLAVLTLLELRKRDLARHFCGMNLIAGNYDFSGTPSQRQSDSSYFLSPQRLTEMREAAFPNMSLEELRNPEISSLYADLSGLPPALFTVGSHDAVRDDSLFMHERWRACGSKSELALYPGGRHLLLTEPTQMAEAARRRVEQFILEA